jgi:hypothetical protein
MRDLSAKFGPYATEEYCVVHVVVAPHHVGDRRYRAFRSLPRIAARRGAGIRSHVSGMRGCVADTGAPAGASVGIEKKHSGRAGAKAGQQ